MENRFRITFPPLFHAPIIIEIQLRAANSARRRLNPVSFDGPHRNQRVCVHKVPKNNLKLQMTLVGVHPFYSPPTYFVRKSDLKPCIPSVRPDLIGDYIRRCSCCLSQPLHYLCVPSGGSFKQRRYSAARPGPNVQCVSNNVASEWSGRSAFSVRV